MHFDAQAFSIVLCSKGLEGLHACLYDDYHLSIPAITPCSRRKPLYPSQKFMLKPRSWVKSLE
jgi:hypothetical protein